MLKALMLGLATVCGVLSFAAAAKEPPGDSHSWDRYVNARFQYSICFPKDVLTPQREADNSDGRRFLAKDGAALAVWGGNNALSASLKQEADETALRLAGAAGRVTYRAARANWIAISGENGAGIFYSKIFYNRKADQFKQFEMTYEKSQAALYNPIVSRIAACFTNLAR